MTYAEVKYIFKRYEVIYEADGCEDHWHHRCEYKGSIVTTIKKSKELSVMDVYSMIDYIKRECDVEC